MVCDTCKEQRGTAYGEPCGWPSSPKSGRPVFSSYQEEKIEISGDVADGPGKFVPWVCVC